MTTMQRTAAAAGSAVFFALAPGTIVGLVPWLITDWHPGAPLSHLVPLRVLGAVLVVAGTAILVSAFARFVVEGLGTPAPVAPPAHLVVGGLYRAGGHVADPGSPDRPPTSTPHARPLMPPSGWSPRPGSGTSPNRGTRVRSPHPTYASMCLALPSPGVNRSLIAQSAARSRHTPAPG